MGRITKNEIFSVIQKANVKLDWEKIEPEISLAEQGADSLDMISIIFAFQEKYNVEITDESISNGDWLSIDKMLISLNKALKKNRIKL
jgi:acyl carrier protein